MAQEPRIRRYAREEYTAGLICASSVEAVALANMLDEQHQSLPQPESDGTSYSLGTLSSHKVVIVYPRCHGVLHRYDFFLELPNLFPSLQTMILVGTGAGVPSELHDIRLGDVVVALPSESQPACIELASDPQTHKWHITTKHDDPSPTLIFATNKLAVMGQAEELISRYLTQLYSNTQTKNGSIFSRPPDDTDIFQRPEQALDQPQLQIVQRCARFGPRVHHGPIASVTSEDIDVVARSTLQEEHHVLCIETEAVGLLPVVPSIVIRGICDYADGRIHHPWQTYAAATAAAYTKALLFTLQPTVQNNERPEVATLHTLFPIPFERCPSFHDREALLGGIHSRLHSLSGAVLIGKKGVGKTSIAVEMAHRWTLTRPGTPVVWIYGSSKASWILQLRKFVWFFDSGSVESKGVANEPHLVESRLLARSTEWLLILDNIDEDLKSIKPSDHQLLELQRLLTWIVASLGEGQKLLVTSTRDHSNVFPGEMHIDVNPFSITEAEQFLQSGLYDERQILSQDANNSCARLARQLGWLPLSLTQARAYMIHRQIQPDEYLNLFQDVSSKQSQRGESPQTFLAPYVGTLGGSACDLLLTLAAFGYNAVPDILIQLTDMGVTRLKSDTVALSRQALIRQDTQARTVTVRNLISTVIRHNCNQNDMDDHIVKAGRILLAQFPKVMQKDDFTIQRTIEIAKMIQGEECLQNRQYELGLRAPILCWMGRLAWYNDHDSSALKYFASAHQIFARNLGEEHIDSLNALESKVEVLYGLDRHDDANTVCRELVDTLTSANALRAMEHPRKLLILRKLAVVSQWGGIVSWDADKLVDTKDRLENLWEMEKQVFGSGHPLAISTMNELGKYFFSRGKMSKAERIYSELVSSCNDLLGTYHADTLTSLNNLVSARSHSSPRDAQILAEEVLEKARTSLSSDHPIALNSLNNFGTLYYLRLDLLVEAKESIEEAVKISECTGDDSNRSTALMSIAQACNEQGEIELAQSTYEKAFEVLQRTCGIKNLTTAICMCNLAILWKAQGYLIDAALVLNKICDILSHLRGSISRVTVEWIVYKQQVESQLVRGRQAGMLSSYKKTDEHPSPRTDTKDMELINQQPRANDIVIAVVGVRDASKSAFINRYLPHLMPQPHGSQRGPPFRAYRCSSSLIPDFILIDTPDLDHADNSFFEILQHLANWLTATYSRDKTLNGIIYLGRSGGRIFTERSEDTMSPGDRIEMDIMGKEIKEMENEGALRLLGKLCGGSNCNRVVLTFRLWQSDDHETFRRTEREMVSRWYFWSKLIAQGATVFYDDMGQTSGEAILEHLYNVRDGRVVWLDEGNVDIGENVNETRAVNATTTAVGRLRARHTESLQLLLDEVHQSLQDRNTTGLSRAREASDAESSSRS